MTYLEKLKDPRWQKRRLELFEAANWTCNECGTKTETLHAHHGVYRKSKDPWDYEDGVMHVLCERCHADHEVCKKNLGEHLALMFPATVNDLARALDSVPTADLRDGIITAISSLIRCELPGYEWPRSMPRDILHWLQDRCVVEIYHAAYGEGNRAARDAAKTA